jgi:hypothetical protein
MQAPALLAEAIEIARQLEYQVREEDLEGAGGGHCSFAGKKWLLLDVTQSAREQLDDVADALRCEPTALGLIRNPVLSEVVRPKRAA